MKKREDSVELRCDIPRETADVLDACSLAQGLARGQLVNRILSAWTQERLSEHLAISNVVRDVEAAKARLARQGGSAGDLTLADVSTASKLQQIRA